MYSAAETHSTGARWYAVWTRSRQEKSTAALLETLQVPHYLPLKSEARKWSDRKQSVMVPLFSGYLFVNINAEGDSKLQVLKAPGVVGLVGNSSGPAPIPAEQVEQIRTVVNSGVEYSNCDYFEEGDRVRVIRGALTGVQGTLLYGKSQSRLNVSIDMIQHSLAVIVSRNDLELLPTIKG